MDKKLMRESEKARAKAARSSGITTKTIELNWAIDGNDLGHRLNRFREFLTKGFRIEVLLAGKKKGRKATEEEAKALIDKLKGVVAEVEGAKESRPMEGKLLTQAKFFAEGKAVPR
jgi:translation initiation factor IF-3